MLKMENGNANNKYKNISCGMVRNKSITILFKPSPFKKVNILKAIKSMKGEKKIFPFTCL